MGWPGCWTSDETWPDEIGEIALIGHSMGGLVARSACHYAGPARGVTGPPRVRARRPAQGAPLEQAPTPPAPRCAAAGDEPVHDAGRRSAAPASSDLGHGYLVDEDWLEGDRDAFWTRRRGGPVPGEGQPLLRRARCRRDADAPVGRAIGDLLVLRPSAWAHWGRGERLRFPIDNYRHVGGVNHFDLLNHPAVYEQIRPG